ncbi:MAG: hypothetical protein COT18_00945 [Elusimicrobia bacterium CG08_land_8_20_14_0_20_59_10]|nr:MAG: hypothetical protein COT18_00945 [Elusimicrobia bacterium CG08_land_8_20_14_0_20_59_10]
MTGGEYAALAGWFEQYMSGFREGGVLLPALEIKRGHSLRTAENAALIAAGLGYGGEEELLARAAGLLHDAGRFTQFAQHGSFRDAGTLDHGLEGRRVLEEKMPDVLKNPEEKEALLCAVSWHNRRTEDIPRDLPSGRSALLKLVRDADKLDIFDIVLRSVEADGFRELPAMLPNIKLSRNLTPGVLAKVLNRESPASGELSTLADFLLSTASWFFDLNYLPSRRLAVERGVLRGFRRELPRGAELDRFFAEIEKVLPFLPGL